MKETFGSFIEKKRLESLLTISDISNQIFLTCSYIRLVERNKRGSFRSKYICSKLMRILRLNKDEKKKFRELHEKYRKQKIY
tara:strand:- start:4439 stop:4684 length:246 start_codon:yes stop_codon:yes gene_type:complete